MNDEDHESLLDRVKEVFAGGDKGAGEAETRPSDDMIGSSERPVTAQQGDLPAGDVEAQYEVEGEGPYEKEVTD